VESQATGRTAGGGIASSIQTFVTDGRGRVVGTEEIIEREAVW
jgi:hypothetical protein